MAAKPSSIPRWADVGGDIVEPTSGKKDVGWVAGEHPPAEYLNWLFNLSHQWIDYLDDGALAGSLALVSDISPTIAANTNDWAPTDLATAQRIRVDVTGAARNLTGLTGGADGRLLIIHNISASYALVFVNESASSSAANRFAFGFDVRLETGGSLILVYDATSSRWRIAASHRAKKKVDFYLTAQPGKTRAGTWSMTGGYVTPTAAAEMIWPLQLALGDEITGVAAEIQGDDTNQLTIHLERNASGTFTDRGTPGASLTGTGIGAQAIAVGGLTSEDVGTDGYYQVMIESSASDSDLRIYGIQVTVMRSIA